MMDMTNASSNGVAPELLAPESAAPESAIEAHEFAFRYPAGEDGAPSAGIGPVDWRVDDGAFALVVGATGSGKTTLLRCLKPAIAPEGERAGELSVFGQPIDELTSAEAASLVGFVFQSPENQLVCDTVWHELAFGLENLGTPPDEMRRRVAEVAHFFGIEPWFRRQVAELSGGQKQMLALAGVLVMQPRLLVLDEPTAQLDPVAEKNFLHALFRVNRELGISVVVATHAPEACAEYATCAFEIEDGRLCSVPLERFVARPLELTGAEILPGPTCCGEVSAEETLTGKGPTGKTPDAGVSAEKASSGKLSAGKSSAFNTAPAISAGKPSASTASPAIELRDAYVRYSRDDDWVLRGCDLAVRRGSVHAVVGGNGCGKSTLLSTIAGVLTPARGRVRNALASRQALLPQDPKALFVRDTVLEELQEWQRACGYADADVHAALARFGLRAHANVHPYDLSGGQQQQLALAKLLLTDPDLLLFDEPTKGLDAAAKSQVAATVRECAQRGVTVLMATHDLAFVALVADVCTMLFDGEATCTEPADTFFANNLFYRPVEDAFVRTWLAQARAYDDDEACASAASPAPADTLMAKESVRA